MKSTHRILLLILSALLFLSLLGCRPADVTDGNGENLSAQPGLDADRRFFRVAPFAENGGVYYAICGEYLMYYDTATKESGVLCGRPECSHTDYTCDGFVNLDATQLSYYDGKLYWMGVSPQLYHVHPASVDFGIWRMDPDGTNRELVKEFPEAFLEDHELGYQNLILHRSKAYLCTHEDTIENGEPGMRITIYETGLDRESSLKPILEWNVALSNVELRTAGNYLYLLRGDLVGETEDRAEYAYSFLRYNLATGETETVSEEIPAGWENVRFTVTQAEVVYLVAAREGVSTLFQVEGGRLKEIRELSTGELVGTNSFLSENLTCTPIRSGQEQSVIFCDLEGQALYAGAWHFAYRDTSPGETLLPAIIIPLGGEKNYFIVKLFDILENKSYYVRYDITSDGIKETVLFCYTGI